MAGKLRGVVGEQSESFLSMGRSGPSVFLSRAKACACYGDPPGLDASLRERSRMASDGQQVLTRRALG
jgi:hypothetical protein